MMAQACRLDTGGGRLVALLAVVTVCAAAERGAAGEGKVGPEHGREMAGGLERFRERVRPILLENCVECHGGERVRAELDMATRDRLLAGGQSGSAIVPGDAESSRLYQAVTHAREPHMPHRRDKLDERSLERIREWIELGAPYDKPLIDDPDRAQAGGPMRVTEADRQWWSFRPLADPPPPVVADKAWVRTGIDRFILAELERAGIEPNEPADRRRLIRRAYLGVTGLPPAPERVEAFVNDASADAWAKVVDDVLASPHYGERWGRHWLDVARFAESHGFEQDYDRPHAYHYRDFVIRALNEDMPFDRFVRWQLAGDEIAPDDPLAMMATGFLGAGVFPTQLTEREFEGARYDEMDDMLATTGVAMLGVTIGCARCHDHKYDPVPERDYYRMLSTFTTTIRGNVELELDPEGYERRRAAWEAEHEPLAGVLAAYEGGELAERFEAWLTSDDRELGPAASRQEEAGGEQDEEAADAEAELAALLEKKPGQLDDAERERLFDAYRQRDQRWRELHGAMASHEAKRPERMTKVMVASEGVEPIPHHADDRGFPHFYEQTHVLSRGDVNQKRGVAEPGFLQVLTRHPEGEAAWLRDPPEGARTSHRRRALADWITDAEYGAGHLLARVIVNRLWQHHLGRGIVATPNDFGVQGMPPTHSELLDYLARELIANGWRLKPIHRRIMTSAVYQLDDSPRANAMAADPDNELFWRWNRRRLEAEPIRDSMLAVSGVLDTRMYGRGPRKEAPERAFGPSVPDDSQDRRSIYFFIKRSELIPFLTIFDKPEPLTSIAVRPTTTVAPQALLLMNNREVRRWAEGFAARVRPAFERSAERGVRAAYALALQREPTEAELAEAGAFLAGQAAEYERAGQADDSLVDLCQMLLASNEFVYVD